MKRNAYFIFSILTLSFFLSSCFEDYKIYKADYSGAPAPFAVNDTTPKIVLDNGLIYYEIEYGTGPFTVNLRDVVSVYYTGRKTNGDIFDSTYRDGFAEPSNMALSVVNPTTGRFSYIDGFRYGFVGMKEGGKRKVVIPPKLGYGGTSSELAKDTLIFDIELAGIVSQKVIK